MERYKGRPRKTPKEKLETQKANLAKAQAARKLKFEQREIVRQKVEAGLPITEPERELLGWKGGRIPKEQQEGQVIAAAAKLLFKPQSVTELRVLVEKTAAKHGYNPIESLIKLTQPTKNPDGTVASCTLDIKEQIAIHKAMLPFLVPVLSAPKPVADKEDHGVKVTVTQFVFPKKDPNAAALHTEKPATVETTNA